MTFKSVRHLAGFTIKPLLGVMFVRGALLPAAPAGAIVGGQPDGNGHRYVGFLDASPIGRPDGPTGVLTSPEKLPLLLLTVPGRQSGTLACPLLGACGGPQRAS